MKRSVEMMGISHEKKVGKSPVCLGAESGGKTTGPEVRKLALGPSPADEEYKLVPNWETDAEHMT